MEALLRVLRISLYAAWAFLLPTAVQAHHSFGLYADELVELQGVVVDVSWRNPHVRFTMEVEESDGSKTLWTLEAGASYVLNRRGISEDLFAPGKTLFVAGRSHTREAGLMLLSNVLLETGQEILMTGGVEPRWSRDIVGSDSNQIRQDSASLESGLFRIWSRALLRPITYGEDLPYKNTPLTGGPQWIERLNSYAQRCEPTGMPGVMATPYPFEFVDKGDSIELFGFSNNAPLKRTIYLPAAEASLSGITADRMGISRGTWQTENLFVIRTTRIDWPYFDDTTGTKLSEDAVVTEYLRLSEDRSGLDYLMQVEDSNLFDQPVRVIDTHWAALGESLVYPTECTN